jgi:hypothetical protein
MKHIILPLTACFTLIVQGAIISSAQAATSSDMPGICEFHEGGKLKLQQSCAIVFNSDTQSVTLFWEDDVKTYIKTSSPSVDDAAAEKIQDGDRTCYQINENSNRVCYETSRKKTVRIVHGCGTGCRVDALLITSVRQNSHKLNGKSLNTASFYMRTGQFLYDEQKKRISEGGITYAYASCSAKTLGFSQKQGKAPETFQKLSGDDFDYTTAAAGRGYYFDALCK